MLAGVRRSAPWLVLVLAIVGSGVGRARDWSQGPARVSFDLGVVGLVAFDDDLDDKQLGGFFGARVQRWGPLTFELTAFGSGAATGDPAVANDRAIGYTLLGVVPGLGVDFGNGSGSFGFGLIFRPPIIVVRPDRGDERVRTPRLRRTFFRVPNFTLTMGDARYFIELGGSGDPTPLEPRLGWVSYQWRDPDWSGSGAALGLGLVGLVRADGDVETSDLGVALHLAGWFDIGEGILLGARADVSTLVSLCLTFTYARRSVATGSDPQ